MGVTVPCIFFILIICTNTVITAETHHRRAPQGFQGVRGKRNAEELNSQNKDFENNHQILVLTTTEQNFRNNELRDPELLRGLPPLSVVKRAPMGFMGMRGKKEFEYTDYDRTWPEDFKDSNHLMDYLVRYAPKRVPSGFMGMRGKKLLSDEFDAEKRQPSGFTAMRGKKEDDILSQLGQLEDIDNSIDEYDADFFENLQNERSFLNEFSQKYGLGSNQLDTEKRAPSSGFYGMRGKKSYNDISYDDDVEQTMNEEKRAPSSGFYGMRGKKDMAVSQEKRAPSPGFFGMRGKKGPGGSGFFGTRGKKGPFEFRGKFVGVRGKKVPAGQSLKQLALQLGELESPELQSAALVGSEFEANKRGRGGFQAMRG